MASTATPKDTSREPGERVFYTFRRTWQQTNVAGGAISVDIAPAQDQAFRIVSGYVSNSGTNTLQVLVFDEDAQAQGYIAVIGSAAGTNCSLPSVGTPATATANAMISSDVIVIHGQRLKIRQTGAGAQNDTFMISLTLDIMGRVREPTFDISASTNVADITGGGSTISSTNEWKRVKDVI